MSNQPTRPLRPAGLLIAIALFFCPASFGQVGLLPPIVTGVSESDAAVLLRDGAATDQRLVVGTFLFEETFDVAADRQVMIHSPSGRATLILIGPARAAIVVKEESIDLSLESGRLIGASDSEAAEQPVHLRLTKAGGNSLLVEAPIGRGWTYVVRTGDRVEIGFQGIDAQSGELPIVTAGLRANLPSGKRMIVDGGKTQIDDLEPWLAQNDFGDVALTQTLCLASARSVRDRVQHDFVENLVVWDKRIQARAVIETLDVEEYQAEIRQVSVSVAPQILSSTTRSSSPQTSSFAAANEMPTLSPAAISVGGVTAVNLNANARGLLSQTQSRGLGFNGLRLLAIPGFGPGGRTVGPAGLGGLP